MIAFPTDRKLSYEDLRDLVFRSRCEMAVYGTIATRVAHVELVDQCKQYKESHGMTALYIKSITVGNAYSINLELPDIELIDDVELARLSLLKEPYTRWFLKVIEGNPIDDLKILRAVQDAQCKWVDMVAGGDAEGEKIILKLWSGSGSYLSFCGRVK